MEQILYANTPTECRVPSAVFRTPAARRTSLERIPGDPTPRLSSLVRRKGGVKVSAAGIEPTAAGEALLPPGEVAAIDSFHEMGKEIFLIRQRDGKQIIWSGQGGEAAPGSLSERYASQKKKPGMATPAKKESTATVTPKRPAGQPSSLSPSPRLQKRDSAEVDEGTALAALYVGSCSFSTNL